MRFQSSSEIFATERAERAGMHKRMLRFGISFVDDSLLGILPDDLVLVGASTGVGKTQLCVNIALANIEDGKRVHFFALEASEGEIERRLKFQAITERFYADPDRPRIGRPLYFDEWEVGLYDHVLDEYERDAEKFCATAYKNLHTFYKTDQFDVATLIEMATFVKGETDLLLIDHAHYFDWDDDNDNRAIKEIAKTTRDLCKNHGVPIVLVAHLRKRDKKNAELVPGLDEFHGSSDLTKIATKVVTLASGGPLPDGGYQTYVRTPKNRKSSASSRYLAQMTFNAKRGSYEQTYKIGWANAFQFGELGPDQTPNWVGRTALRK